MTSVWNFLNLLLLVTAIAVTSEKGDVRKYIRIPLDSECIIIADGVKYGAKILDVSEGGVSVAPELQRGMEKILIDAQKTEIELTGVDGVPFVVPSSFLRAFNWGKTLIFEFDNLDEKLSIRTKIIQLVYGNTTAWSEFESKHKVMNPLESIYYILKQSFKNAMFKEAIKLTLRYFQNYFAKLLRLQGRG
jgi:hypothetical protein